MPVIETIRVKPGEWIACWYVADVSGGTATLLTQSQYHTKQEIEEEGRRIRAARRSAATRKKQKLR